MALFLCLKIEKQVPKDTDAVVLLNQEYIQSFFVTEETRTQDLQEICRFLEQESKRSV